MRFARHLEWGLPMSILCIIVGCERPAQPMQQYDELKRLSKMHSKIRPTASEETCIQFNEIYISVVGPNNSTLGAAANWELLFAESKVQKLLRDQVLKVRPELGEGEATSIVLLCRYFDSSRAGTGEDSVEVQLFQNNPSGPPIPLQKGNVRFKSLGIGGQVAWIEVELEAIGWQTKDRQTRVDLKRK
jgi:hypothetical protein